MKKHTFEAQSLLLKQNFFFPWAVGLAPVPAYLVPKERISPLVNKIKEAGRHLVLSIVEELQSKYSKDTAKGTALIRSVEHVYGSDTENANIALTLSTLISKDRENVNSLLQRNSKKSKTTP